MKVRLSGDWLRFSCTLLLRSCSSPFPCVSVPYTFSLWVSTQTALHPCNGTLLYNYGVTSVKRANVHNIFELLPSNEIQHLISYAKVESIQNTQGRWRARNNQSKFLILMHFHPESYLFSSDDKDHTSLYYSKQNKAWRFSAIQLIGSYYNSKISIANNYEYKSLWFLTKENHMYVCIERRKMN